MKHVPILLGIAVFTAGFLLGFGWQSPADYDEVIDRNSFLDTSGSSSPRTTFPSAKKPLVSPDDLFGEGSSWPKSFIGDEALELHAALNEMSADALAELAREMAGDRRMERFSGVALQSFTKTWVRKDPTGFIAVSESIENKTRANILFAQCFRHLIRLNRHRAEALYASLGDSEFRHSALAALVEGMNPRQALELIENTSTEDREEQHIIRVLSLWGKKDLSAALTYIDGHLPEAEAEEARWRVISGLPSKDALAWVETHLEKHGTVPQTFLPRILANTLQSEPARTAKLVGAITSQSQREQIGEYLASYWALQDPMAMTEWVKTIPEKNAREDAAEQAYDQLAFRNPEAAAKLAGEVLGEAFLDDRLYKGARRFADVDYENARAWMETLPDGLIKLKALAGILVSRLDDDPQSVFKAFDELDDAARDKLGSFLAPELARTDLEAALTMVEGFSSAATRFACAHYMMPEIGRNDPVTGLEKLQSVEDAAFRTEAAQQLVENWSQFDPVAPIDHLDELHTVGGMTPVVEAISRMAYVDSSRAAEALNAFLERDGPFSWNAHAKSEQEEYLRVAKNVAEEMGSALGAAALDWAYSLPEPALQEEAIAQAVGGWAKTGDAAAASAWVEALPEGTVRDQAASQLVNALEPTDFDTAFYWATQIGDASNRMDQTNRLIQQEAKRNPQRARETLLDSGLPLEEQMQIARLLN